MNDRADHVMRRAHKAFAKRMEGATSKERGALYKEACGLQPSRIVEDAVTKGVDYDVAILEAIDLKTEKNLNCIADLSSNIRLGFRALGELVIRGAIKHLSEEPE